MLTFAAVQADKLLLILSNIFVGNWALALSASVVTVPLIMGIWWKGANKYGVIAGVLIGGFLCMYPNAQFAHPSFTWSPITAFFLWQPIFPGRKPPMAGLKPPFPTTALATAAIRDLLKSV